VLQALTPRLKPKLNARVNVTARTLEDLGFTEVLKALAGRCRMEAGQRRALARPFLSSREEVEQALALVEEAQKLKDSGRTLPLGGLRDVQNDIERAAKGGMLEPRELIAVSDLLASMSRASEVLQEQRDGFPELAARGKRLPDLLSLAQKISKAIEPSGEISDRASPELADARAKARGLHRTIKGRLDKYLHDERFIVNLREAYYSVRNDRYVVPVVASHRGEVPGIVHNASQSGQTLFVEPEGLIGLGNDLAIAQSLVLEEERRILTQLSDQIGRCADPILEGVAALAELDEAEAAAQLAFDLQAHRPTVESEEGPLQLLQLRHPRLVLRGKDVVPNDITIRDEARALVVSGPNAGGKTVTLTAVGLCALMLRTGLPIPAASGSRLPLYRSVHSTVGDAQDLTQDLSTFSAHVAELKNIVDAANKGALVLIDEIAADTNPREGAALAVAVLEELLTRGAVVLVTTHLEELKALAHLDTRFVNARVGFDAKRMQPTYKLQMGFAGSSSAIEIAARMGLSETICARARELALGSGGPLTQAITAAEEERRRLAEELERARIASEEALRLRTEANALQEQLDRRRSQDEVGFREALIQELERARVQIREHVEQLKAQRDLRTADDARKELTSRIAEQEQALRATKAGMERATDSTPLDLRVGGRVRHVGLDRDVEILELEGKEALVAIGPLKTRVAVDELAPARERKKTQFPSGGAEKHSQALKRAEAAAPGDVNAPNLRCDLRGMRADDALREMEQFLDRMFRADERAVLIVHGHGTGALKNALRQYLDNSGYVRSFRPGGTEEGGDGVTVVTLRT
jgi:DNA mismatch repair protein MutS2